MLSSPPLGLLMSMSTTLPGDSASQLSPQNPKASERLWSPLGMFHEVYCCQHTLCAGGEWRCFPLTLWQDEALCCREHLLGARAASTFHIPKDYRLARLVDSSSNLQADLQPFLDHGSETQPVPSKQHESGGVYSPVYYDCHQQGPPPPFWAHHFAGNLPSKYNNSMLLHKVWIHSLISPTFFTNITQFSAGYPCTYGRPELQKLIAAEISHTKCSHDPAWMKKHANDGWAPDTTAQAPDLWKIKQTKTDSFNETTSASGFAFSVRISSSCWCYPFIFITIRCRREFLRICELMKLRIFDTDDGVKMYTSTPNATPQ